MSLIQSAQDLLDGQPVKMKRLLKHVDRLAVEAELGPAYIALPVLKAVTDVKQYAYAYGIIRAMCPEEDKYNFLWQLVLTELAILSDFQVADELADLKIKVDFMR